MKRSLFLELGRRLLTTGNLLITAMDVNGIITFVNPYAERVTACKADDLVGRSWASVFASLEQPGVAAGAVEEVCSGRALHLRLRFRGVNGTTSIISWESFPVSTGDDPDLEVVAIGKDLTPDVASGDDIRRELEILTEIVDTVGAGLNLLNSERRILWANAQMRQWFGREGLVGSYCYEKLHEEEHAPGDCPSFYTFKTGNSGSLNRWATTTDGERRFFQFITTPVLSDANEVTHILELIVDMTVRKEIEERRVESERMATVGELARAVAHEIRNPMTVIGGFTRRLKEKVPEDPLVQETADVILNESRRLEDMVLKVNLFLNPKDSNYTRGHVQELLALTLKAMSRDLQASGIKVETAFHRDIPPQSIDKNKIRQVFFNILQNALEVMPEGGALLISSAIMGGFVEVRIQDTGPGIDEEDVGSIFHAFFTRKDTGLGLGLTIASQIIHEHGGYINVENTPDKGGALFIVGLPLYTTGETNGRGE